MVTTFLAAVNGDPMKINMKDKYMTRDGRPVRVLCVDRKGKYRTPVVALLTDKNGENESEELISCEVNGRVTNAYTTNCDLVPLVDPNIPTKDTPIDTPVWVRDSECHTWKEYHFAGINEDNQFMVWAYGATSHTSVNTTEFNYCTTADPYKD